jgi:cytidylate kinase
MGQQFRWSVRQAGPVGQIAIKELAMPIITIGYQIGSGSHVIGQQLAERLGLDYIDREIIRDVAERLQVSEAEASWWDERVVGRVARLLAAIAEAGQAAYPVYTPESEPVLEEQRYFDMMRTVVEAVAQTDRAVIVGHGANFALANRPGVLHLFLYADVERRIATLMAREQVDHAEAARRATRNDHRRGQYVKRFYQCDWCDPRSYDLLLNTALLPLPNIVDLLAGMAQSWMQIAGPRAEAHNAQSSRT